MMSSAEAFELVKKQIDEWEQEGVLEEKLIEYGFIIINKAPSEPERESQTE